jgi:hypothetical protein
VESQSAQGYLDELMLEAALRHDPDFCVGIRANFEFFQVPSTFPLDPIPRKFCDMMNGTPKTSATGITTLCRLVSGSSTEGLTLYLPLNG